MAFDPSDLSAIGTLKIESLDELPIAEDSRFEFKSSRTPEAELAQKIERAASAFWNSGGGFIIAGVDGSGAADGGIARLVGRQARRDWVDQAIHRVTPVGPYQVALLNGAPLRGALDPDNGVLVVAFGESSALPHMASDNRYYIRAGAHTAPASHFIVESLRARRGQSAPLLTFYLKPSENTSGYAEMEVINLSSVPAVDLTVAIDPLPPLLQRRGSSVMSVRILDAAHPARVPFTFVRQGPNDWERVDENYLVIFRYKDTLGREYENKAKFLPRDDLPKPLGDRPALEQIAISLQRIENRLATVGSRPGSH